MFFFFALQATILYGLLAASLTWFQSGWQARSCTKHLLRFNGLLDAETSAMKRISRKDSCARMGSQVARRSTGNFPAVSKEQRGKRSLNRHPAAAKRIFSLRPRNNTVPSCRPNQATGWPNLAPVSFGIGWGAEPCQRAQRHVEIY